MKDIVLIVQITSVLAMIIILMVCWIQNVKAQKYTTKSIICILSVIGLIFICCLVCSFFYKTDNQVLNVKSALKKEIESVRYGTYDSEKEQIVFRASNSGSLYLRGMIGINYDLKHDTWKENSENLDTSYVGMMEYLKKQGFYPQNQLAESLSYALDHSDTISIQNRNASRKYIYAPECVSSDWMVEYSNKQLNPNRILPKKVFGDNEYQFHYWLIGDAIELLDMNSTRNSELDSSPERIYRAYVYDYYMNIPKRIRAELADSDLESVGGENQAEVIKSVRRYLNEQETMTSKEYATKAVMLLRYCGIPARYVDGYYVEYKQPNKEQILMNNDRHQWAEVYLDGIGFARFETDPDFFENHINHSLQAESQQTTDVHKDRKNVETPKKQESIWIMILGIFILAVLLTIFLVIYHKMKKKKYLYSTNATEFTSFLCIRLEKLLKYDNVLIDIKRPYDYQKTIFRHYGSDLFRLYIRFLRYTDEVQFNKAVLSEEEQAEMRMIVKRFEIEISNGINPIKRMFLFQ